MCYHFTHDPRDLHHYQRFPDIPTEIDFDRFGSDQMMCFGAAPAGMAAPMGMVGDSCEERTLRFVNRCLW